MLSAQQELGDTGTAHGSDMRDIDHETCQSPTGNVSTNHLCSPRANFGYMGKMLVLGACLTDAYLVGWGICESEKVRRGGYHTIKETPIGRDRAKKVSET